MVSERGQPGHGMRSLALKTVVNSVMEMKSPIRRCSCTEQGGILFLAVDRTSSLRGMIPP